MNTCAGYLMTKLTLILGIAALREAVSSILMTIQSMKCAKRITSPIGYVLNAANLDASSTAPVTNAKAFAISCRGLENKEL